MPVPWYRSRWFICLVPTVLVTVLLLWVAPGLARFGPFMFFGLMYLWAKRAGDLPPPDPSRELTSRWYAHPLLMYQILLLGLAAIWVPCIGLMVAGYKLGGVLIGFGLTMFLLMGITYLLIRGFRPRNSILKDPAPQPDQRPVSDDV